MTAKIRKYVLPNIPYLLVAWFFLKLGTAYRLTGGANIGMKLIGLMQNIPTAFESLAPSLNGFDWLIGITGAVIIRAVIYFKVKKVKSTERMWSTVRQNGARKRTSSRL